MAPTSGWRPPPVSLAFREALLGEGRLRTRDYLGFSLFVSVLALAVPNPLALGTPFGVISGVMIGGALNQRRFGRPWPYQLAAGIGTGLLSGVFFGAWTIAGWAWTALGVAPVLGFESNTLLIAAGAVVLIGFAWFVVWRYFRDLGGESDRDARFRAEKAMWAAYRSGHRT